jgi:quinol-cytochrome oxidoreductase complex cytochrome b subunit
MAASETLDDIKSKGILWVFGVLTLVVLVVLFILGAWWGS